MRKMSLFVIFLLGTSFIYAQNFPSKGTIELGGSVGFSSTTSVYNGESSDHSLTSFSLQPYFGYFIINNFELGIVPSFTSLSYNDQSQTNFGIYVAPAWNFDLHSNIFPFVEARLGYNTSSYDDGNSLTDDPSSSGLAWGLRGGLKAQVGNSALVNVAVSYDQITLEPSGWSGDRIGENIFGINAGFTIFFAR